MDYMRGHCERKLNSLVLNESSLAFGQFSSLKKKSSVLFFCFFLYIRVVFSAVYICLFIQGWTYVEDLTCPKLDINIL